jgi:purine-binding chemotaxis protein CheW
LEQVKTAIKIIAFQLANESYGISIDQVRSIERMQNTTRVPQTPDFIKGVINLRGVIIPIIDLKDRLELGQTTYTDQTRILIVRINSLDIGLIVDSANDVIDIDLNMIEPAPEIIGGLKEFFIKGVAKLKNRLLVLLDIEQILNFDELNEIQIVSQTEGGEHDGHSISH